MRHRVRTTAGLTLLAFAAGCDALHRCTLIGCAHALTVNFATPVAFPYKVEVESAGGVRTIDCPTAGQCAATHVSMLDFSPDSARIIVTTPSGTLATSVKPVYTTSRPNGRDCEPTCRSASVTVPVPQL